VVTRSTVAARLSGHQQRQRVGGQTNECEQCQHRKDRAVLGWRDAVADDNLKGEAKQTSG
jgi:hypothetical protein